MQRRLRSAALMALALLVLPTAAAHAEPEGYPSAAIERHPEVLRKVAALATARAAVRQLDAVWTNPTLVLDGSLAPGQTDEHSFGVAIDQRLPLWNARGPAIRAARARVRAAEAELATARVTAAVVQAAAGERALLAREEARTNAELHALAVALADAIEKKVAKGQASPLDLTLVRLEAARAASASTDASALQRAAEIELCRLFGAPDLGVLGTQACAAPVVVERQLPASIDDEARLVALALGRRGELLAGQELAAAAALELLASERGARVEPIVGLGVQREQGVIDLPTGPLVDGAWHVTASLSIPLPLFSAGAGDIARARAARGQAALEVSLAEREIIAEVRTARARAANALVAVGAFDGLQAALATALVDLGRGYEAGTLSLSALLTERDRVIRARSDALRVRRAWLDAREALELAIGGPIP